MLKRRGPVVVLVLVMSGRLAAPIAAQDKRAGGPEHERASQLFEASESLVGEGKLEAALEKALELEKHTDARFPDDHWWRRDAASRVATMRRVLELPQADRSRYVEAMRTRLSLDDLEAKNSGDALARVRSALETHVELLGEKHRDSVVLLGLAAKLARRAGQSTQAIDFGEKAIRLGEEVLGSPHPFLVAVYEDLSTLYSLIPRDADVERICPRALELAEALWGPDDGRLGVFADRLAMSVMRRGRPVEALGHARRAHRVHAAASGADSTDAGWSLMIVGEALMVLRRHEEARERFDRSIEILERRKPNSDTLGQALTRAGKNCISLKRLDEAEKLLRRAAAVFESSLGENSPHTGAALHNLAMALEDMDRLTEAETILERVLRTSRRPDRADPSDVASSLAAYGQVLSRQYRYTEAEPVLRSALEAQTRARGEGHPNSLAVLKELANLLEFEERHDEASALHHRVHAIYEAALGPDNPRTLEALSRAAVASPDSRRSKETRERLLDVARRVRKVASPSIPRQRIVLANVGKNLSKVGHHDEARELLTRAVDGATRARDVASLFPMRAMLAFTHVHRGELDTALALLRANLESSSHPRRLADSRYMLARVLVIAGKLDEALPLFELVATDFERERALRWGADRVASPLRRSPYPHLGAIHIRQDRPAEAWQALEASAARTLFDYSARRVRSGAELERHAELRERLNGLRRERGALAGKSDAETTSRLASLERRESQVFLELAELRHRVRSREAAIAHEPFELERVQRQIPPDTALVLWLDLMGREGNVAVNGPHVGLVLRHRGPPHLVDIAGSQRYRAFTPDDRRRYRHAASLCRDPGTDPDDALAALRTERLVPLERALDSMDELQTVEHLVVLPSSLLESIPIELLTERYAVSYCPSATVFASIRERAKRRASDMLLVADPDFGKARPGELPFPFGATTAPQRLPGTRREAESIVELLRSSDGVGEITTLLGGDATAARLAKLRDSGALARCRIVHLATHARIDSDEAARSTIELARSGVGAHGLTAREVADTWKLDADLVTLSTCETASTDLRRTGYMGFAQAFFVAGARSVLLSRWKADDTATRLLMARFYSRWLEGGLSKAHALRDAKRWLRRLSRDDTQKLTGKTPDIALLRGVAADETDKLAKPSERPYSHPFFWAGFVLHGDPY